MTVPRFGIVLDEILRKGFDDLIRKKSYSNRSEAVTDLIRDTLVMEEREAAAGETVENITTVYSRENRVRPDFLTGLRHLHHILIFFITLGVIIFSFLFFPMTALARDGEVSMAFFPGSPIESNFPLTLPAGGLALSTRVEQVEWRRYPNFNPTNKDSSTFLNLGLCYGIKPYLTGSVFLPYSIKREDSLGSTSGIGDIRFMGILGFNYDGQGVRLNSSRETAITLEAPPKTLFSFYGGFTLPTGKSKVQLGGEVDPTMQPGFGSPSFTVGFNASRSLLRSLSLVFDTSYDIFTQRDNFKFGNEWRVNLAGVYRLYGNPEKFISKIDGILELNFLNLARNWQGGEGQPATGGNVLYLSPGLRFFFPKLQNACLGLLIKIPIFKRLNEQDQQQGSEGLEKYTAIASLSFFF